MQFSSILSVAACLALTHAAPTPEVIADPAVVAVTFIATDAQYTVSVPLDGLQHNTDNALSISSVSSSYDVKKYCIIHTVDNFTPKLTETSPGNWLLEPPQTAISIACSTYVPDKRQVIPRPPTVNFKFTGSGVENYSLAVPVDGTVVPTSHDLPVASITTPYTKITGCNFVYSDSPVVHTLAQIGAEVWAVGPPQTIVSIQCDSIGSSD